MSDEKYWMYQSPFPTPSFNELPEGCFKGNVQVAVPTRCPYDCEGAQ